MATRQLSQKEADIQMMLAADVHLGTKNCDFQMERYVFKRRSDVDGNRSKDLVFEEISTLLNQKQDAKRNSAIADKSFVKSKDSNLAPRSQDQWRGIPTRLNNIPHSREIREYFYNGVLQATERAVNDRKTRLKVEINIPELNPEMMGAPKQKWTAEEEPALKAGIVKHGARKWRTILKDPEFSGVLYMRSNVDLKDKWRNMSVMANGWGSRDKNRLAIKKMQYPTKQEENATSASDVPQSDEEMIDVKPSVTPTVSSAPPAPLATLKKSIMRSGCGALFIPATGKSLGYTFIKFNTPQEAELAKGKTNGYRLDKAHMFAVNMYDEIDKFMRVPDEWAPSENKPYTPGVI